MGRPSSLCSVLPQQGTSPLSSTPPWHLTWEIWGQRRRNLRLEMGPVIQWNKTATIINVCVLIKKGLWILKMNQWRLIKHKLGPDLLRVNCMTFFMWHKCDHNWTAKLFTRAQNKNWDITGDVMSYTYVNVSDWKLCIPVLSEAKHKHHWHQPVRPDTVFTGIVSRFLTDRKDSWSQTKPLTLTKSGMSWASATRLKIINDVRTLSWKAKLKISPLLQLKGF